MEEAIGQINSVKVWGTGRELPKYAGRRKFIIMDGNIFFEKEESIIEPFDRQR